MRCSRDALSLLLAVLGGAVIALGLADGRNGVAADICPEQPPYTDTSTADVQQNQFEYVYEYAGSGNQESTDQDGDYEDAYVADAPAESEMTADESQPEEPTIVVPESPETSPSETEADESEALDDDSEATDDDSEATDDDSEATEDDSEATEDECGPMEGQSESMDSGPVEPSTSEVPTPSGDTTDSGHSHDPYGQYEAEYEASYGQADYKYSYPEEKYGHPSAENASELQGSDVTTEPQQPEASSEPQECEATYQPHECEPSGESQDYSHAEDGDYSEPSATEQGDNDIETGYGQELPLHGEPGEPAPTEGYGEQPSDYTYSEPCDYYGRDSQPSMSDNASDLPQNGDEVSDEMATPSESAATTGEESTDPADGDTPSGPDLSAWLPSEWLTVEDQQLLRRLSGLDEEPVETRRSVLGEYLEVLGTSAVDFATRFEEIASIEPLGLATDTTSTAALLVTYRLIERGEVSIDQGIDMLRRSFETLGEAWLDDLDRVFAVPVDSAEGTTIGTTMLGAIRSWAAVSLNQVAEALRAISQRLAGATTPVASAEQATHSTDTQWQRF